MNARHDAIVTIANAVHAQRNKAGKAEQLQRARIDGMCEIATKCLGLGIAPFGLEMAVRDAVMVNPVPNTATRARLTAMAMRDAWEAAVVEYVSEDLGLALDVV